MLSSTHIDLKIKRNRKTACFYIKINKKWHKRIVPGMKKEVWQHILIGKYFYFDPWKCFFRQKEFEYCTKIIWLFAARKKAIIYGWSHCKNEWVKYSDSFKKEFVVKWWYFVVEFGLFNYVIIFISGLVIYAAVLETISFAYALPVSECDLNLSTSQKGILGAATFVGFTCSSHLWGFLADTRGKCWYIS